jgi:hypothetical protein
VEQHAEGSSYASEDLHHGVDDGVLLGWDVGFTADRCESWHGRAPFLEIVLGRLSATVGRMAQIR